MQCAAKIMDCELVFVHHTSTHPSIRSWGWVGQETHISSSHFVSETPFKTMLYEGGYILIVRQSTWKVVLVLAVSSFQS